MTDHDADADTAESPAALLDDPRIEPDHLRVFDADDRRILLVGAVHDHPASVARVRRVVRSIDPATVAVELPPLALPLFADGSDSEMSVALAATDAEGIAIDSLGPSFVRSLWREIRTESPDSDTIRQIAANAVAVCRNALSCRLASIVDGDRFSTRVRTPAEYDLAADATPSRQADHEQRHLSRSFSILRTLERPLADEIVDAARERTMARRLSTLDGSGSVVAVVGFEHLDGISDGLTVRGATERSVEPATLVDWEKG